VLCTATQPALKEPRFKGGLIVNEKRELAPDPSKLYRALKRTTERLVGTMADSELLADVSTVEQALVIVNTRAHALALYRRGKETQLDGLLHLSTRQVAADRRRILEDVRRRLKAGLPCRVIATSLIEAGVDVSFPRVWRAEAGLDQIIQAAGRCNREWEWPVSDSIVTVFRPADAKPQSEIAAFAVAMHRVADKHGDDLFSQAAIMAYFEEVYWQRGEALDKHKIVEGFRVSRGEPSFPYRTVAEKFRLIESGMEPVIIAAEENAKDTLSALKAGLPPAAAARRLQNYIVQVPPKDRAKLIDNGHVRLVDEQFAVLTTESLYTRDIGLLWAEADSLGEESWFI
jgi:CRISPR-associated endonuclease/helicase Cas3